jgi:hypothetical protein
VSGPYSASMGSQRRTLLTWPGNKALWSPSSISTGF